MAQVGGIAEVIMPYVLSVMPKPLGPIVHTVSGSQKAANLANLA
jgi:hypothetical protein